MLIEKGLNLDYRDEKGNTALHYASENGCKDIVLLLLNKRANKDLVNNDKETALFLACQSGQKETANCLFNKGQMLIFQIMMG